MYLTTLNIHPPPPPPLQCSLTPRLLHTGILTIIRRRGCPVLVSDYVHYTSTPPPLATIQPDSTSTAHGQTNHIRRWGRCSVLVSDYITHPPPPLATMQPDSTSTEHGQTNHIRRWGGVQSLYLTTLHIHPPPPSPCYNAA